MRSLERHFPFKSDIKSSFVWSWIKIFSQFISLLENFKQRTIPQKEQQLYFENGKNLIAEIRAQSGHNLLPNRISTFYSLKKKSIIICYEKTLIIPLIVIEYEIFRCSKPFKWAIKSRACFALALCKARAVFSFEDFFS